MNGDRIAKLDKQKHTAERQEDRKREEGVGRRRKRHRHNNSFLYRPRNPSQTIHKIADVAWYVNGYDPFTHG